MRSIQTRAPISAMKSSGAESFCERRQSRRRRRRRTLTGRSSSLASTGRLSRPWDRSVSVTGREHLDPSRADPDRVAGDEERRRCDALAVHPGSVQRSEVLDLEPIRRHIEDGVRPRHLEGRREPGRRRRRALPSIAPRCGCGARPRRRRARLRSVASRRYPSTLPRRWCQNLHQPNRPGWSLPPSRAIPRKSVWVGCPSLRCVHTMTASRAVEVAEPRAAVRRWRSGRGRVVEPLALTAPTHAVAPA